MAGCTGLATLYWCGSDQGHCGWLHWTSKVVIRDIVAGLTGLVAIRDTMDSCTGLVVWQGTGTPVAGYTGLATLEWLAVRNTG